MNTAPPTKLAISEEDAARLRTAVMRLARDLRKTSTQEGLTATQSSVLATVVRAEELSLSELAGAEGLNPTMLSRVIGFLEESNLLVRVKDSSDRRAARVRPSAQGKKLIQRLRNRRTSQLLERIELLDEQSIANVLKALPALEILSNLQKEGE